MNSVCICGRLTKDPETRATQGGTTVTTFTLAVDRRKKDDGADFIKCVAFGKSADTISKYVHKGDMFGITGRISTRSYENKNGQKVFVTEVIVNDFTFLQPKAKYSAHTAQAPSQTQDEFYDSDIPF